ncbi:hypothetical protein ACFVL4_12655, partial [Bacillus subtilis]
MERTENLKKGEKGALLNIFAYV